jgi:endoglycosylceramidase
MKTISLLVLLSFILIIESLMISKDGFIKDHNNNTLIFHGINMVHKTPPYYPIFTNTIALQLYNDGYNVIRLGIFWKALEPVRNKYNLTYLNQIENIVKICSKYGISVILDNHQDVFSPKFCGEGFPDWLVGSGANPLPEPLGKPVPINSTTGYPLYCNFTSNWQMDYFTDAVNVVFQNLYDNYDGYLISLQNFWSIVVNRLNKYPNILAYELINEPWAGNVYDNPLNLEPGYFEKHTLQNVYMKLVNNIKTDHIIMLEPLTWDYFPTGFTDLPKNTVLSYHIYCLDIANNMTPTQWSICNLTSKIMFKERHLDTIRLGVPGFLTEFGEFDDNLSELSELGNMTYIADKYMQSWTYYGVSEKTKNHLLIRPYPQIINGLLLEYSFNTYTREFTLKYLSNINLNDTVIYIASNWYPDGYNVTISPAIKYIILNNRIYIQNDGIHKESIIYVHIS